MASSSIRTFSAVLLALCVACVHAEPHSEVKTTVFADDTSAKGGRAVRTTTVCRDLGPGQGVPVGESLAWELTEDGRCFSRECAGSACVDKGNPELRDDLVQAVGAIQKRAAMEKLRKSAKK